MSDDDLDDVLDDANTTSASKSIGILDIKLALESTFKGCKVTLPSTLSNSFHATLTFFEYEVRVILAGTRTKDRTLHYRFQQLVPPVEGRKPVRRSIIEIETKDPAELLQAIEDSKSYLMGVVFAITKALKPPNVSRTSSIDDLFRGDDE